MASGVVPDLENTKTYYILAFFVPVLCGSLYWWVTSPSQGFVCYQDLLRNQAVICKPQCPPRQFGLPWTDQCLSWLTCREIESPDLKIIKHIGNGAVKMVYLVDWRGRPMVLNTLLTPDYKDDFQHGLKNLAGLQGSSLVTQFLGACKNSYLTEYHQLGSAGKIGRLLTLESLNSLKNMLQLCVNYAEVINYLHTSPTGTRVMCDSNDLQKTLDQFLVREDLRLLANDVDALPQVNRTSGKLVKCGHRPLNGDFVAPEQIWPHEDREFRDEDMPAYSEMTDIWKIPDVCEYFLDLSDTTSDGVKFSLFKIHKQCKSELPEDRPSASEVLYEYKTVLNKLN